MNKTERKLSELFCVYNGVPSSNVDRIKNRPSSAYIPYIRPSHRQSSSIDGFVNKFMVPSEKIFPKHTIYVSTDGQGSHSYAYVSVCDFVPNSNISVLIPKNAMNLQEKLFYACCITKNRYKFSYGRKPKGERLNKIILPASLPENMKSVNWQITAKNLLNKICFSDEKCNPKNQKTSGDIVPLGALFSVHNGASYSGSVRRKNKENENWIPYIRPSHRQETSIDTYVNRCLVPQDKIFPKESLYVSTNGQGSHTFSYVSTTDFIPNSDVSVLIPMRKMNLFEKLFYAQCITNNRYKFSYGRKPKGERLKTIMLPESPPQCVASYSIENLVKKMFESVFNSADII